MKRIAAISAALTLIPALAPGHPGHFVLDYTAGPPHAGHESEVGILLIAILVTAALANVAYWLVRRRR